MQQNGFLGKQLGSYCLVKEIARGGFGIVYLGQHTILTERLVAIKVLHDLHLSSASEREAFLQEARFLEKLKHPFILPLLDVGIEQNIPFLITEYAEGGSLRMRIQKHLPDLLFFNETFTILSQVGQALQHAHQQNIIHRDLKPDNILFTVHGDALLADFGVATVLSTASIRHTSATGTPAYMAPEQFRGQVSRETDQYALGCIAYELFTGQKPFTARDFIALGFKHTTEQPVAPRQLNPRIPESVEQAILKAMAKERSNRYPDVATFITALQISRPPQLVSLTQAAQPAVAKSFAPTLPPAVAISSNEYPLKAALQSPVNPAAIATVANSSSSPTMEEKLSATLSYLSPIFLLLWAFPSPIFLLLWLVVLLIIYLVGQQKRLIRFHLMQANLFTLIIAAIDLIFPYLAGAGGRSYFYVLVQTAVALIFYYLIALILVIRVFQGKYAKLPLIGSLAEKFANRVNKQI